MNTAIRMGIATAGVSALFILVYQYRAIRERSPTHVNQQVPEYSDSYRITQISPEELIRKLAPYSGAKGYHESRKVLGELDDERLRKLCGILIASKNDQDSMLLSLALAEGIARDVDHYYVLLTEAPPMMLASASKAAFNSLCKIRPDLARDFLTALNPGSGVDRSILMQGIESLVMTDPEIAMSMAKADPRLINTVLSTIADSFQDPNEALAVVATLESSEDRKMALSAVVRTLARKDPAACFTAIATLDPESFGIASRELFSSWMSTDWDTASAKAKSLESDGIQTLLSSNAVFDLWLARDPDSITKFIQDMQLNDKSVEIFARYYLQKRDADLHVKLREIAQLPSGGARESLILPLLRDVKGSAIGGTLEILGEVTDPQLRLSLTKGLARTMQESNHEERIKFLTSLNSSEKDAAVVEFSRKLSPSDAWSLLEHVTDSSAKALAEGRIWERERDQLRKDVVSNPQQILGELANGRSAYSDYWLEEAMVTWISKEPDKAEEWYQANWNSLPPAKSQYVAAAYAKNALGLGDTGTARQWTSLIQDPKTRERIEASITKGESGGGQ
jgi:hypothetical protein